MNKSLKNLKEAISEGKDLKMFIDGKFIDTYHFEKKAYKGETFGYIELEDLLEIVNDNKIEFEVLN